MCRKFIINVPHIHNIASQIMIKVYFETFQSLQLTNIMITVLEFIASLPLHIHPNKTEYRKE